MPEWTNRVSQVGSKLDDRFDALKYRLRKRSGSFKQLQVLPYRGFGNSKEIYLKGRVLSERESPKLDNPEEVPRERIWTNILSTYRRLHSIEVPRAVVRITHEGETHDILTNEDGYFELHLPTKSQSALPWRDLKIELLSPKPEGTNAITATAHALVPPKNARFGIISDIDDTIIVSNARNLLKAAYTTFSQSARGRVAFPGVGAFYRALQSGTNEGEFNPVFYVSSGPWNLYDLLVEFMQLNQIPLGPILLQDYGLTEKQIISASHLDHKLAQIRKLLETYPDLPFILIGDSGQHDPEIYRKVLEEVPTRIKAIYIRDVAGDDRDAEVLKLAEEAREHGGELILVRNSLEGAKHAVEKGFISATALPEISGEKIEDETNAATEPDLK
ncbi:MAG TPA: phosphatase domain-containing protein [Verrucomicrobiae bacterium]